MVAFVNCAAMYSLVLGRVVPRLAAQAKVLGSDLGTGEDLEMGLDLGMGADAV
jgi:hypothetical protein